MRTISPDELRADIGFRTPRPLYLLTGPDTLLKTELAALFSDVVEPELRAFNVERLYGGDVKPGTIVEAARTLPLMVPRRVVIVLQAEKVLVPKRESESADQDLEPLADYLERPVDSTTLVFVAEEELNRQRRLPRLLMKHATLVECGGAPSASEAARLVADRAAAAGMTLERHAVARLIELTGGDSARLRAACDRVLLFVGRGTVTAADVDEVVAAAEVSADDWGIVRALERRNAAAALRELRVRLESGDTVYAILGQIAWAVRTPPPKGRFPADRLPAAVDALFRTDVALKSSGGDPRVLLERLIVELCG